jgi:hypothetical protein
MRIIHSSLITPFEAFMNILSYIGNNCINTTSTNRAAETMTEGYVKQLLKFAGYSVTTLIIILFFFLFTREEQELEEYASYTQITEDLYNHYEWGQYQEDFEDVVYFGDIDVKMVGDTSGLNLDQHYFRYLLTDYFEEDFGPIIEYINMHNYEYLELKKDAKSVVENCTEHETGTIEVEIQIKQALRSMPIYYKVTYYAGTVDNPLVYDSGYINMCSYRKLNMGIEHALKRETLSFAKKFFKIQNDEMQLKELYKSIFQK